MIVACSGMGAVGQNTASLQRNLRPLALHLEELWLSDRKLRGVQVPGDSRIVTSPEARTFMRGEECRDVALESVRLGTY